MDILVVAKNFTEKPGRLVKAEVTVKKIMSSFSVKALGSVRKPKKYDFL